MRVTPKRLTGAKRLVLVGLLLVASASFRPAHAQCDRDVFSSDTYYGVLDIVFPRPSRHERNIAYTIVLRYLPSFTAESQIVINATQEGRFQVARHTPQGDGPNINNQIHEFREKPETCTNNPAELAKVVQVQVQEVQVAPAVIQDLLKRFSRLELSPFLATSIVPHGADAVCVDGTRYELWFYTNYNEAHYELSCSTVEDEPPDHPLVRWMQEVNRVVESALKQSRQGTTEKHR